MPAHRRRQQQSQDRAVLGHKASAVTTAPARSMRSGSVADTGISFVFASASTCSRTTPAAWSSAASRCCPGRPAVPDQGSRRGEQLANRRASQG